MTLKICFFGDSICFGQHVPPPQTWVAGIEARLKEDGFAPFSLVNNSVCGNTTRQALERIPEDLQAFRPDVAYVQFGMNDCNFWQTDQGLPRVSPAAFEANLLEIAERARRFGARCVLLATNHPSTRQLPPGLAPVSYAENNERYNQIVRSAAGKAGAVLVDNGEHWRRLAQAGRDVAGLLMPDGVHLSREGHRVYQDYVYPFVRDAAGGLS